MPDSSTAATTPASSSSVSASGFSTKTALPASSALRVSSACELCRVTTNTASTALSPSTASRSVVASAKPNFRWALAADSAVVVTTVDSSTPSRPASCGSSIDVA